MGQLQQQLDKIVGEGVPGVIAEVRTPDETWFGTAGTSDTTTDQQRTRDEHFRIGSVTKAFTAIVTLQLVGRQALSLDDSVERWLPGLVRGNGHDGTAITVRHLLAQTSGLFNYSMDPGLLAAETGPAFLAHRGDQFAPANLVRLALAHEPSFAPGSRWDYSNTNYILAGMVVEAVSGRAFGDVLAELVTEPLGLHDTYLPVHETTLRAPNSHNYTKALLSDVDSPVYDATELHPSKAWTAGGMVSTLSDLNAFFGAVFSGQLLAPEQQLELLTTRSTAGGNWLPDTEYGLGIFAQTLPNGRTVWGGCGAINGTWTLSMGSLDGSHRLTANLNCDYGDLLTAFVRLAAAEFTD